MERPAPPTPVAPRPRLRGWSHAVAAVAATVLCPIVIALSPGHRVPVALYAGAVIALFAVSASYHCLFWGTRARAAFRRIDHATIFIVIAATYTPIALATLERGARVAVLTVVWIGAAIGATTQLAWPRLPRWLTVSLYVAVGWAIVPVVHDVWGDVGVAGFVLLLAGGILHTLGAVVYALERPDPNPAWFGFHEVFHALVVGAIAAHYVVIAFFI